MNNAKKININHSSLIGLKAELLRKQLEVKDTNAKRNSTTLNLPKVKVKNKKKGNKEKKEKNDGKSGVTEIEDVNMLKKSKYMLEAKSRLYEQLKKNHGDGDHNYLVDFEHKSDDSESDLDKIDEYEDDNVDPEEDWIEYEDCFGRTRKCLRKDLPKMREKDDIVKKEVMKDRKEEFKAEDVEKPEAKETEKEPEIEVMRKKWEEQTERLAQKTDIHYQDLLFDEARAHGVGYYGFSQDEEERARQQANLTKLRKETEQRQRELQEMKELKSKMSENRLKIARIRQRARAGLPIESDDDEAGDKNDEASNPQSEDKLSAEDHGEAAQVANKPAEGEEKNEAKAESNEAEAENSLAVIEDKIKAFGELLGKRPKWRELSQAEWVEKRRKDRHGEFAPAYDNFKSAGYLKNSISDDNYRIVSREGDQEDPLRISGYGPEPSDFWESSGSVKLEKDASEDAKACTGSGVSSHSGPLKDGSKECLQASRETNDDVSTRQPGSFRVLPSAQASFSVFNVPPPVIDTSVPPPSLVRKVSGADEATCDEADGDSDDSDIIGPMPPGSSSESSNYDVSQIPLPCDRNSSNFRCASEQKDMENELQKNSLNVEKIAAGLKYLREKFENVNNS